MERIFIISLLLLFRICCIHQGNILLIMVLAISHWENSPKVYITWQIKIRCRHTLLSNILHHYLLNQTYIFFLLAVETYNNFLHRWHAIRVSTCSGYIGLYLTKSNNKLITVNLAWNQLWTYSLGGSSSSEFLWMFYHDLT